MQEEFLSLDNLQKCRLLERIELEEKNLTESTSTELLTEKRHKSKPALISPEVKSVLLAKFFFENKRIKEVRTIKYRNIIKYNYRQLTSSK